MKSLNQRKKYALKMRNNPTRAELSLKIKLQKLKTAFNTKNKRKDISHIFDFETQYLMSCYILDFYFPHVRVAVEVDGGSHKSVKANKYDLRRDMMVLKKGVITMRFSNEQVLSDPCHVIRNIYKTVLTRGKDRGIKPLFDRKQNKYFKQTKIKIPDEIKEYENMFNLKMC